jgi:tRNA(fMet)-specific endonuclease VapC
MGIQSNYLLDTGIVGAYLNNDLAIRRRLKGVDFFISIVVAGELYHGAFNSTTRNLANVRQFLALQRLVPLDEQIAERFGILSTDLQQHGRVIPQNDIWIAAQAMQLGLTVVTRDAHFEEISGLKLERW